MKAIIFILFAFIAYSSAHVCKAEGDPHYRSFGGHRFNFYATGEYVLFKRHGFQCNTKLTQSNRHWRGRSLNSGVSCKFRGVSFEVDVGKSVRAYLNNRKFRGSKTIKGVHVRFSGRSFSFKSKGMEMRGQYNRIRSGNLKNYLNLYVYSHKGGASGLCQGHRKRAGRTFFHHGKVPRFHIGKKRRISRKWRRWAAAICRRHFKVGSFSYNSCVTDMATSKRKRVAGQYQRFHQSVKGRFKKVCHGHHCHYYKRVTHVRTVRYARHHWKKHKIVDHKRRRNARRAAANHKRSIARLHRSRKVHIKNTHRNANRTIKNLKSRVHHATRRVKRTVSRMNKWRNTIIKSAKRSFRNTVRNIKRWRNGRIRHAKNHYRRVIKNKRKWLNSRIAYANRHVKNQIRSVSAWKKRIVQHVRRSIKRVNKQRHSRVKHLHKHYSKHIRRHHRAVRHHNKVAKSATRIVRRRHTTWHTKKHITHRWVHFHHQN